MTPPAEAGTRAEPEPQPPLLDARGLVREFARVPAVDGIDVVLPAGGFLVVFGPNGAGKTSLLRLLSGLLRPTRGEVRLGGERIETGSAAARARIGVLSHQTFLYARLTARENLRFYGKLYGLGDLERRVTERLRDVGLEERAEDEVQTFSRGMRQRLGLARTLLHDPELVLLDEPYTGLDPHAAGVLRAVLAKLRDGRRTVILVTHNLTQGLELADQVAIQVRGRFAWEGRAGAMPVRDFEIFYQETVDQVEARR